MSRSNPTDVTSNPCTRWFEWAGGSDGGIVRYYDKENKTNVVVNLPFQFILLDQLSTVKGWHDASDSGIYANEVRDTKQDTLVVRSFKGGVLAEGLYSNIRDRVGNFGGSYVSSCYIAFKGDDGLQIGNIAFKGAALNAWIEFKKGSGTKTDANGKAIPAYYADAVKVAGFDEGKKGSITYRTPKFALTPATPESNDAAIALDKDLQAFMDGYLRRPREDAAESTAAAYAPTHEEQARDAETDVDEQRASEFQDDDIPF